MINIQTKFFKDLTFGNKFEYISDDLISEGPPARELEYNFLDTHGNILAIVREYKE